jgi:hypothetical protein
LHASVRKMYGDWPIGKRTRSQKIDTLFSLFQTL